MKTVVNCYNLSSAWPGDGRFGKCTKS